MKNKIIIILAAVLMLTGCLAGCAGGSGNADAADTAGTELRAVGVEFYGEGAVNGEPFYADADAVYYYYGACRRFAVKMSDGTTLTPAEAFGGGKVVPRDLKEYGVDYRKAVAGTEEYELMSINILKSGEIWETLSEAAYLTGLALKDAEAYRRPSHQIEEVGEFFRWIVMPDSDRESGVRYEFEQYKDPDGSGYLVPYTVMESYLVGRIFGYSSIEDQDGIMEIESPVFTDEAGGKIYPDCVVTKTEDGAYPEYHVSCYGEGTPGRGYRDGDVYVPAVCYAFDLGVKLDNGVGDWWVSPGELYRFCYTKEDVSWLKTGTTTLGEIIRNVKPADNKWPRQEMIPSYAQENGSDHTYVLLPGESKGKDILLVFTKDEVLYEIRYDV